MTIFARPIGRVVFVLISTSIQTKSMWFLYLIFFEWSQVCHNQMYENYLLGRATQPFYLCFLSCPWKGQYMGIDSGQMTCSTLCLGLVENIMPPFFLWCWFFFYDVDQLAQAQFENAQAVQYKGHWQIGLEKLSESSLTLPNQAIYSWD